VVEPEFFLELLVRLLADPSRLDGRCERFEGDVGWQVRQIVFLLSAHAPLTHQPYFLLAGHGLDTAVTHAMLVAIGNPDTACGKLAGELAFGPAPPADLPPFRSGQHQLSRDSSAVGDVISATSACGCFGKSQPGVCRMDILAP